MYNVHTYFSLKNLSKKSTHYTQQNMVLERDRIETDEGEDERKSSVTVKIKQIYKMRQCKYRT